MSASLLPLVAGRRRGEGAIYRGAAVRRFINWFDEVQVGGVVDARFVEN